MPVENDPAFDRWRKALDRLKLADDRFAALPNGHPDKNAAWVAVKFAMSELDAAANEIDPKYKNGAP